MRYCYEKTRMIFLPRVKEGQQNTLFTIEGNGIIRTLTLLSISRHAYDDYHIQIIVDDSILISDYFQYLKAEVMYYEGMSAFQEKRDVPFLDEAFPRWALEKNAVIHENYLSITDIVYERNIKVIVEKSSVLFRTLIVRWSCLEGTSLDKHYFIEGYDFKKKNVPSKKTRINFIEL